MAELLLHKAGRGDPGDSFDYQPGDVVHIAADGHVWGRRELGPDTSFLVLKLPGVDPASLRFLLGDAADHTDPERPAPLAKRRVGLSLSTLPATIRDQLALDEAGRITTSAGSITVVALAQQAAFLARYADKMP